MSTPHNEAQKGQIAPIVLMPGDPLRAQYIADHYLENVKPFNTVRNMFGYTGTYKGRPISVMGSGMGIPSIGIYSYELYDQYDVDTILRIGSCGGYSDQLHVFDLILADSAYSESTYALVHDQDENMIQYPDPQTNAKIAHVAEKLGLPIHITRIHSSDVFYNGQQQPVQDAKALGCDAVEMESFGLFHNAKALNKKAACICTVSDSFVYDEITTPEEREKNFDQMIVLALESALQL